jgi:hypothetical protein
MHPEIDPNTVGGWIKMVDSAIAFFEKYKSKLPKWARKKIAEQAKLIQGATEEDIDKYVAEPRKKAIDRLKIPAKKRRGWAPAKKKAAPRRPVIKKVVIGKAVITKRKMTQCSRRVESS